MDVLNYFEGIAVIIDDEINDPKSKISNIINQVDNQNIPILLFDDIPEIEYVQNFKNSSFILLDWEFKGPEISEDLQLQGVTTGAQLRKANEDRNIAFLQTLILHCFCPIFIFTNENIIDIEKILSKNSININKEHNFILLKNKSELTGTIRLFRVIEKWLANTPSIYALKEWQREYQTSLTLLFKDFQTLSTKWPRILWKTFKADGINESLALGDLISCNLNSRMSPFEFKNDYLNKERLGSISKNEIRHVLEGQRYLASVNLHENDIQPGDLFKVSGDYFINIRPECDLVPGRDGGTLNYDDIELYLIKGSVFNEQKIKKNFNKDFGNFSQNDTQSIIFPIESGKAIDFRFKKMTVKKWKDIKTKRKGRLLPPYITLLQKRYALYSHRDGLPRVPKEAIS